MNYISKCDITQITNFTINFLKQSTVTYQHLQFKTLAAQNFHPYQYEVLRFFVVVDIYYFDLLRLFSRSIYTALSINQSKRIGGFPVVNRRVHLSNLCDFIRDSSAYYTNGEQQILVKLLTIFFYHSKFYHRDFQFKHIILPIMFFISLTTQVLGSISIPENRYTKKMFTNLYSSIHVQ